MRATIKFLFKALIVLLVLFILFGLYRTWRTESNQAEQVYLAGKFPEEPLDGFYTGYVRGYTGIWKGKNFDSETQTGINVFHRYGKDEQRYRFRTYQGQGLHERELEVLKLDYNLPGNPFWVRPVLDEIVQIGPEEYLGKINYKFIPGFPFSMGHFRLLKGEQKKEL